MLSGRQVESDGAFIFAAAACFRARIHVHYTAEHGGLMQKMLFAPPPTSKFKVQRDLHVAFVRGDRDYSAHCVSLPEAEHAGPVVVAAALAASFGAIAAASAVAPF